MNNESQAIALLKQLLDAWTNGVDGDQVADIMDRITLFLNNQPPVIDNSGRPVGFESCCEDPGDCGCLDEPNEKYGWGV